MNELCGCCEGIERLTAIVIANRPGLDALFYRAGTHASFLETMLARLSTSDFPELRGLTIRSADDPSIALLDAWATVADVLTFYQERIANEGYLRTAIERRSILELARLVGYRLRPGVAASVYLAYTLEKDHDVTILPRNRAQSVPGPGELPQSFETDETLEARFAWNILKPRLTRPQYMKAITREGVIKLQTRTKEEDHPIYFQGTATNLKAGDALLFLVKGPPVFAHVVTVETQAADNRTRVTIDPEPELMSASSSSIAAVVVHPEGPGGRAISTKEGISFREIVGKLQLPPSLQPRNTQRLERSVSQAFTRQSDIHPQMLVNFSPILESTLYSALLNTPTTTLPPQLPEAQALRVKAAPFGHNAPLKPILNDNGVPIGYEEWPLGSVKLDLQLSFRDGGVSSGETTFGDKVIGNAAVTITQGSKFFPKKDIDLTSIISGGTLTPVTLDNGSTLNIKVTPGSVNTPNEMDITFIGGGIQDQTLHLTELTSHIDTPPLVLVGVQIDRDPSWPLEPNQKQRYSTDQHRVEMDFGQKAISISDEVIASVSNPLMVNPLVLPLDALHDKIVPTQTSDGLVSWVVVERPDRNNPDDPTKSEQIITQVLQVETVSITAYGITGRVTQLTLKDPWLFDKDISLSVIRNTTIYAQSEKRELAEEPIEEDIENTQAETFKTPKVGTDTIELDKLYYGLKSGQRMVISGERTDLISAGVQVAGVQASELIMLKSVTQEVQKVAEDGGIDLPGDKKHSFLHLANKLAYTYKRETVTIYGNVVLATHGETHVETLGSGDGSKALQRFTLRQFPLTYLSAPTPAGAQSTLRVRVNDILWHEPDSLAGLGPTDHSYTTETDDADKTAVIFGNGQYGARLPTGVENVKAVYRTGIGKPGNVKAEQITLLATKPLGVKSVINPLRASGGADRDSRDQARRNVPVALLALDRLVSVQDYADFARTYAGIGKASAVRLSDERRQFVHLTIVGADNIPIDENSDLFGNLFQSLRLFGDPNEPLTMVTGGVMFIVISAKVRLLPDYALEFVEPKIRTALLDFFSFERRELGQPVFQSEVFSVIQSVPGVDFVELEIMDAVDQERVIKALDAPPGSPQPPGISSLGLGNPSFVDVKLAHVDPNATDPKKRILPAQLAFLTPDLPDTLILTELPK